MTFDRRKLFEMPTLKGQTKQYGYYLNLEEINNLSLILTGNYFSGTGAPEVGSKVTLLDPSVGDIAKSPLHGLTLVIAGSGGQAIIDRVARSENLTGARTMLSADGMFGDTFNLTGASGYAITLPSHRLGLSFTFTLSQIPSSGNHTIVTPASSNTMFGNIVCSANSAGSTTAGTAGDTITFVRTSSTIGDTVTLVSNGTNWLVEGVCGIAAGLTITTAS